MAVIFSRDTSPEAERVLIERLRRKTVGQRLAMVWGLDALARSLSSAGARMRGPGGDPGETVARIARLTLGSELAERVLAERRARAARSASPVVDGRKSG